MANVIYMKNRVTGETRSIERGDNLYVFLFGWIYLLIKKDYTRGLLSFIFNSIAVSFVLLVPQLLALVCLVVLIFNILIAWNWHKTYIELLEKKDFEILPINRADGTFENITMNN
jgi:hypothetical protein